MHKQVTFALTHNKKLPSEGGSKGHSGRWLILAFEPCEGSPRTADLALIWVAGRLPDRSIMPRIGVVSQGLVHGPFTCLAGWRLFGFDMNLVCSMV